jgi:hypothetical protein
MPPTAKENQSMQSTPGASHIVLSRRDDLGRAYALLCDRVHEDIHEFVALGMNGRVYRCVATDLQAAREVLEAAYGGLQKVEDLGLLPIENRFICDR